MVKKMLVIYPIGMPLAKVYESMILDGRFNPQEEKYEFAEDRFNALNGEILMVDRAESKVDLERLPDRPISIPPYNPSLGITW